MQRAPALFLQFVTVLIGIGVLGLMLWEPQIEGRNIHATQFQIYFHDPFLAFAYIGSIPFFVALYQAFKLLGYAGRDTIFSAEGVKAARTAKYCALALIGFVALGEIFIFLAPSDDRAGGVFMGVLFTFGAMVMGTMAAVMERILRSAMAIISENDRLNPL